jgi:hypothetical protein
MRNILKLYSGTQSGTQISLKKSEILDSFCSGRKNPVFFMPKGSINNLMKNLQIVETSIF